MTGNVHRVGVGADVAVCVSVHLSEKQCVDLLGESGDVDGLTRVDGQEGAAQPERAWQGRPCGDALGDLLAGEVLIKVSGVAGACLEPFGYQGGIAVAVDFDDPGVELVEAGPGRCRGATSYRGLRVEPGRRG